MSTVEERLAALEQRVADLARAVAQTAEVTSMFRKIGPSGLPPPRSPQLPEVYCENAAKEIIAQYEWPPKRLPRHPLDPDWCAARKKDVFLEDK